MPKIKGDTSLRRKRAILTDSEFETLLRVTKNGPDRRNLSGEMRYWLYLIASQTGIRAHELRSLKVDSFHLDADPPCVEVHCTISKRRTTDLILLRRDFAELLRPWLAEQDPFYHLWSCSASSYYNAAAMVRGDLEAADIN
jgi:integrase